MNELQLSYKSQDFKESECFIERYNLKNLDYKIGTLEYFLVNPFANKIEENKFRNSLLFAEYELTDLLEDLFRIRLKEFNTDFYEPNNNTKKCYYFKSLDEAIKKKEKLKEIYNFEDSSIVKDLIKEITYYQSKEINSTSSLERDLLFQITNEKNILITYCRYGIKERKDSYEYSFIKDIKLIN